MGHGQSPRASMTRLILAALLALSSLAAAWTKEDHEIFRVRDEIILLEGSNTTFYSYLGVPSTATTPEITKRYYRKSARLHPDKAVPSLIAKRRAQKAEPAKDGGKESSKKRAGSRAIGSKERAEIERQANDDYARLVAVAKILQDGQLRERYDHFLANGFPRWRGTGYYYERFRPGLGSVMIGLLVVFGGGVHYGALYLSWKRQREFADRYVREARRMAWGNDIGVAGLPTENTTGMSVAAPTPQDMDDDDDAAAQVPMNRKQKRAQEREAKRKDNTKAAKTARSSGVSRPVEVTPLPAAQGGAKKRVIAENGKVLLVDQTGNVFLEEETAEGDVQEFLLDPEELPPPSITQTALVRLPLWAFNQTLGRALGLASAGPKQSAQEFLEEDVLVDLSAPETQANGGADVLSAARAPHANGEARKRKKGKAV